MKVMVLGNGAREHAILRALHLSPSEKELYAYMTAVNPGMAKLCDGYGIGDILDASGVLAYAKEKGIELAVIGPEAPLGAGVADTLEDAGILCVGPRREPARIETDKSFARPLMEDHGIEGKPEFGIFSDYDEACAYIDSFGGDLAVKPAGLTGGKGVKIMGEHFDAAGAKEYVKEILADNMGGIPKVVLEERLIGEEFTLQGFVDGNKVIGTPMVQDHKRAYEGDRGPNTGGMGSYSGGQTILPFLTDEDYAQGLRIMEQTVAAIEAETGQKYRGFLYGQFMATAEGIKVIEFNARLGDPEAMNILSILESDMLEVCRAIATGTLDDAIAFKNKATVCKYLVPKGYPEDPLSNIEIVVDEEGILEAGGIPYYAAVREEGGRILTSSSRAVAVVGIADSIYEAEEVAESCMSKVTGQLVHRVDIGTKDLIDRRFERMEGLRG